MTIEADWPLAQRTVPRLLLRQAAALGDRPLMSAGGVRWTHAGAVEAVARRAATLQAAGVVRGDRVAILCSNRVEFLEVFLACGWIGAVSVPINSASMGPQIAYFLGDSGARLMVMEAPFLERLQTAELAGAAHPTKRRPALDAHAMIATTSSSPRHAVVTGAAKRMLSLIHI